MKITQDVVDYAASLNDKGQGMGQVSENIRRMGEDVMSPRRRRVTGVETIEIEEYQES